MSTAKYRIAAIWQSLEFGFVWIVSRPICITLRKYKIFRSASLKIKAARGGCKEIVQGLLCMCTLYSSFSTPRSDPWAESQLASPKAHSWLLRGVISGGTQLWHRFQTWISPVQGKCLTAILSLRPWIYFYSTLLPLLWLSSRIDG